MRNAKCRAPLQGEREREKSSKEPEEMRNAKCRGPLQGERERENKKSSKGKPSRILIDILID